MTAKSSTLLFAAAILALHDAKTTPAKLFGCQKADSVLGVYKVP
jgi:hypothetical protein